jgi:hypothetical protein
LVAVIDRGHRLIDMLKLKFNGLFCEARQLIAVDRDPFGVEQG